MSNQIQKFNLSASNSDSVIKLFSLKNFWRNYLLYNDLGIRLHTLINSYRFKKMDIFVVLWPPAVQYFSQIEEEIRKRHEIISSRRFIIDDNVFDEFVKKIYAIDSASANKIDAKLKNLRVHPLEIQVLKVRFYHPKLDVQDLLNRKRCVDAHVLKDMIRKKFSNRVSHYIFDTIIHSTETEKQARDAEIVLKIFGRQRNG